MRLIMPGAHLFPYATIRPTTVTHPPEGLWLALTYVHQRCCGLTGHDLRLHFERRRLCLHCDDCGWQSTGWAIGRQVTRAEFFPGAAEYLAAHAAPLSRHRTGMPAIRRACGLPAGACEARLR